MRNATPRIIFANGIKPFFFFISNKLMVQPSANNLRGEFTSSNEVSRIAGVVRENVGTVSSIYKSI